MEAKPYVDHTKNKTVRHVSLCAGYAGLDLGLNRAIPNLLTVAFSEIEAFACANLVSKMEQGTLDPAPIWTNLKTFPWEQFRGCVDLISGGFPCQPFSNAGKRIGDEDPRHLFPYILKGIRVCRPAAVFLENVEGLVSAKLASDGWSDPKGTPVLLHVLRELERAGYACAWGLFSASEVGAPHQRKRVFILGLEHSQSFAGWGLPLRTEPQQSVAGEPSNGELAHPGLLGQTVERLQATGPIEPSGAVADHPCSGTSSHLEGLWPRLGGIGGGEGANDRWPARPGEPQYDWEAPRVVSPSEEQLGKLRSRGLASCSGDHPSSEGALESAVGGEPDGPTPWLDPTVCVDSRVDELRLLGNGVVPATAERAFRVLWAELVG